MISGTIAGISSFTVYPLGEIIIPRPSYSYYYISYTPSSASGTMWIRSTSTATPVSYQISSYRGMLKFGDSYPSYLSFESCNWRRIETNIPLFNQSYIFSFCSTLQKADLYNCTSLPIGTFYVCSSLSQISLPVCEYVGYNAFYACSSLTQISLPVCSYISSQAFMGCYSLSQISLPMCSYIGGDAFYVCSSLTQISLPKCSYIGSHTFEGCKSLSIITIGYSGICSLDGIGAFDGTKITSSIGSIYVPASLVDKYKSDSYWSYFSAIIQSYPGL